MAEYHSGAHRGSIRILEGRRGVGWSVFEFQVRKYFLGEVLKSLAAIGQQNRSSDEGVTAVGYVETQNGRPRPIRKSRQSRSNKSARDLKQPNPLQDLRGRSNDQILMAISEPRPTRSCTFKWKPISRTLSITLEHGSRRRVSWIGLETKTSSMEPQGVTNENGPVDSLIGEAQQVEIRGPGDIET